MGGTDAKVPAGGRRDRGRRRGPRRAGFVERAAQGNKAPVLRRRSTRGSAPPPPLSPRRRVGRGRGEGEAGACKGEGGERGAYWFIPRPRPGPPPQRTRRPRRPGPTHRAPARAPRPAPLSRAPEGASAREPLGSLALGKGKRSLYRQNNRTYFRSRRRRDLRLVRPKRHGPSFGNFSSKRPSLPCPHAR